jgi:16S rRNA (cytidine1402-2'-O)-methyltransferase
MSGKTVALVSDAGTPGISDPGQQLIAACIANDIEVDPLPGPCAAIAALSGSGFPMAAFTYQGFLARKGLDRAVSGLASIDHPVVLYESPRRIVKLLEALAQHMPGRDILLVRELTKLHQQLLRGKAATLLDQVKSDNLERGEFTLVLGPWQREVSLPGIEDMQIMVEAHMADGMSARDAISKVSAETRANKRELYKVTNKKKQDT